MNIGVLGAGLMGQVLDLAGEDLGGLHGAHDRNTRDSIVASRLVTA